MILPSISERLHQMATRTVQIYCTRQEERLVVRDAQSFESFNPAASLCMTTCRVPICKRCVRAYS